MSEESQEAPINAETLAPSLSNKNRIIALVVVVVIALAFGFGTKMGLFASPVGMDLNNGLTQQFTTLGGDGVSVTCPESAKFYAGATIICDVTGAGANSLMPNLKFINVTVMTHGQYRAMPVNGY